jgi:hypothetical protein
VRDRDLDDRALQHVLGEAPPDDLDLGQLRHQGVSGGSAIAVFAPRWPLAALSDDSSTPGTRAVLRLATGHLDPESHPP